MATELETLLRELIDIDDTAVPAFIHEYRHQLLTAAAIDRLAQLSEAAPGPRTRQRLEERLQLLLNRRKQQEFADLPPDEQLYTLFRQTADSLAMQNLVLQVREGDLNALDDVIAARRAAADDREQAEIDERHAVLQQIRAQLQEQYGDYLPFIKRLNAWLQTKSWQESQDYLRLHKSEMLSDPAQAAMQMLVDADPDNPLLEAHQLILRDSQRHGIVRAYANHAEREAAAALAPERERALSDLLLAWLQQPTLAAAEAHLADHASDLLTADATAVMRQIVLANAGNLGVREHYRRLRAAREEGVAAVYTRIRQQRLQTAIADLDGRGPVATVVARFLQLPANEASPHLQQTPALHTPAAGQLLSQLAAAAAGVDSPLAAQIKSYYALWQEAQ